MIRILLCHLRVRFCYLQCANILGEDQYDVGECVDEEKPPSLQMIKLNATNPNSPHRRSTAEKIHSNQLVDPFEGTEIFEEMVSVSPTSRVIKRDSFPAAKNKEYHEDPSIISEQGYDLNNDKERDFKPVPNVGFVQEASPDKKMKKLTFKNRLSEEKAPPSKLNFDNVSKLQSKRSRSC